MIRSRTQPTTPSEETIAEIFASELCNRSTVFGIPAVTIGAIFNLVYLAILFYFFIVMPDLEGLAIGSLILYAVIWAAGIGWYFYWKSRNKVEGVDVNMTFGELPPD